MLTSHTPIARATPQRATGTLPLTHIWRMVSIQARDELPRAAIRINGDAELHDPQGRSLDGRGPPLSYYDHSTLQQHPVVSAKVGRLGGTSSSSPVKGPTHSPSSFKEE